MVQVDPPCGGPPWTEGRETSISVYQFFTASKKSTEQALSSSDAHSAEYNFIFFSSPDDR